MTLPPHNHVVVDHDKPVDAVVEEGVVGLDIVAVRKRSSPAAKNSRVRHGWPPAGEDGARLVVDLEKVPSLRMT